MQKKITFLFLTFFSMGIATYAQSTTYKFADRDTCKLYMDVYKPTVESNHCCVLYVFGGGFISGERNNKYNVSYAQALADRGYTVSCIDYRLGLKGANMKGLNVVTSLQHAIQIAVEDLFSATEYLIAHAGELGFDADKIVLCGSSAGAITVLQGDYELCNRTELAKNLPATFHYAGVMSFSGAIFSCNGAVKYKEAPAPTFLMHGIEDRLVTYKSIRFFKKGFFGAKPLIKRFEKFGYPYFARRYVGLGHEVATLMKHNIDICDWFIDYYVLKKEKQQIDETIEDETVQPMFWGKATPGDLYH